MGNFVKLNENNVVVESIVIDDTLLGIGTVDFPESEPMGIDFIKNVLKFDGTWKQTSWSGKFRKRFASKGSEYLPEADVFIYPPPHPSWILNENFDWVPPVPKPGEDTEEGFWEWNENILSWQFILNNN